MRILVFVILFLNFSFCFSQKGLFFAAAYDSEIQAKFVKNNNLQPIIMIYQQSFVKDEVVDKSMLNEIIQKLIPNINYNGYVVFDWEGTALSPFLNLKSGNNYNKYLKHYSKEFLKVLKIARSLRPNAKFSFYKLPGPSYNNADVEIVTRNALP